MYDMEGNKDAIKRIDGEIEAVKEQIKNIDRKEHALIAVD